VPHGVTGIGVKFPTLLMPPSSPEADTALHPLQDASLGSLTVYVVPETSSLLPQVGSSTLRGQPLRASPLEGALGVGIRPQAVAGGTVLASGVLARASPAPGPHPCPFPRASASMWGSTAAPW